MLLDVNPTVRAAVSLTRKSAVGDSEKKLISRILLS